MLFVGLYIASYLSVAVVLLLLRYGAHWGVGVFFYCVDVGLCGWLAAGPAASYVGGGDVVVICAGVGIVCQRVVIGWVCGDAR